MHTAMSEQILGRVGRRTSIQIKYLDKVQTSSNRDALCKHIYQCVFGWVLRVANAATMASDAANGDAAAALRKQAQRSISILVRIYFPYFAVPLVVLLRTPPPPLLSLLLLPPHTLEYFASLRVGKLCRTFTASKFLK